LKVVGDLMLFDNDCDDVVICLIPVHAIYSNMSARIYIVNVMINVVIVVYQEFVLIGGVGVVVIICSGLNVLAMYDHTLKMLK
jgi:hypothetical protein